MMPFEKGKKNSFKKFPNLKGIQDNTLFLKGGRCNDPLKNDKEQAKECDGSANGE